MTSKRPIPWEKLYHYILACGNVHEPYQFSVEILAGLKQFVRFDQALVYFMDGNRKIRNQYLWNINQRWSNMYIEYYSQIQDGLHGPTKEIYEKEGTPLVVSINWDAEPESDFLVNYIQERGLHHSLAFALFDLNGMPRTSISLDRTSQVPFSEQDVDLLKLIVPQLNNLHKNFFIHPTDYADKRRITWETAGLTRREIEIVDLLCQGVSPENASKVLCIAISTTYKHIAHIYKKLHVSSQQELLVRLLNQQF